MPKIPLPAKAYAFCKQVDAAGGTVYVSGGSIRDHLLKLPCKDLDLEVHNIAIEDFKEILSQFGSNDAVGKSFGVNKCKWDGMEIDIALPQNNGMDDPFMGEKEACRRRDLSINAMLYNPLTDEILDFFGGQPDIQNQILRATDPVFFAQDPLRVFRLGQFAGRFQFNMDSQLVELCQSLNLRNLAIERIWSELEKGWIKSPQPSMALRAWNRLQCLTQYFEEPLLQMDEKWLSAFDIGKKYCTHNDGWNMAIFWGLLLHKLHPPQAGALLDKINIHNYLGFPLRRAVLASLEQNAHLQRNQSIIVQNHAAEAFSLEYLAVIAHALQPASKALHNLEEARKRQIHQHPLPKLIGGSDLLELGLIGKEIGLCQHHIRQLQLNAIIHCRDEALQEAQDYAQKHSNKES